MFTYINGYLHKGIGTVYAVTKEKISDIQSTSHSRMGKPTFLVIGKYNKDGVKAVWLDIRNPFKPIIENTAIITDAISEDEAVTLINNSGISHSIDSIQLEYCDKTSEPIKEGVHWVIYDGTKSITIYVDAFTSKYAVFNNGTGEYDLTKY